MVAFALKFRGASAAAALLFGLSCASCPSPSATASSPQREAPRRELPDASVLPNVATGDTAKPSVSPEIAPVGPTPSSEPRVSAGEKPKETKPTALPTTLPDPCGPRESLEEAHMDLLKANALIERAGEHPMDGALLEIIPRLQRAAYAGDVDAQIRFGNYVVGYWFTDEMFWPEERAVAISALAMLRVGARKAPPNPNYTVMTELARNPVVFSKKGDLALLPRDWVNAALAEAKRWEDCPASTSSTREPAGTTQCPELGDRERSTGSVDQRLSGVKRGWSAKRVLSVAGKPTECHENKWYYIAGQYSGPEVTVTVTFKNGIVTEVDRSAISCRYYDMNE